MATLICKPLNETELRLVESLYADSDNGGTETVLRLLATVRDREARLLRAVEACGLSRFGDSLMTPGRCECYACKACRAVLAENADLLKGESP